MDRRNFVALAASAAVVAPIAAIAAHADDRLQAAVSDTAWDAAVSRVHAAKTAHQSHYDAHTRPVIDRYYAGLATWADASEAEEAADEYAGEIADAINAMTIVPAPTLAALHWKISAAHAEGLFDGSKTSDAAITAIMADVARLGMVEGV